MTASIALTMFCLLAAIICLALGERHSASGRWPITAWLALLSGYGACVGIVATVLVYFFSLGPLVAILLGIPAGIPTLIVFARMSES